MGSSNDHVRNFSESLPRSFCEYLRDNENIVSNIFKGVTQGPRNNQFMKKTRVKKSYASVPFMFAGFLEVLKGCNSPCLWPRVVKL